MKRIRRAPVHLVSLFEIANAPPSLLLWSARGGRYSHSVRLRPLGFGGTSRPLSKRTEGARDAAGPKRTRRLRCLTAPKRIKQPRFTLSRSAKGSASPPVPRRPARGVYRFAPHGPRWTYLSGNLPYGSLPIHRSRAQTDADMPATGCRLRPSPGPRGARLARRDTCGLDRRAAASHLRCDSVIPRPPLPAPCLKMLIRHPSVTRRDARIIGAVFRAGISFFRALNLLEFFAQCSGVPPASSGLRASAGSVTAMGEM